MPAQFISIHDTQNGMAFHAAKVPQINGLFTVLTRFQQHQVDKYRNLTQAEADKYLDNFVRLASVGQIVYEPDDTKYPGFEDAPITFS